MRWFLVVLLLGTAGAQEVADAKKRARAERKPVLCLVLGDGPASKRLRQAAGKVAKDFVVVEAPRADHAELIKKYGIARKPAVVVYTSLGTPMKLVVGAMSPGAYARHFADALKKHKELWTPNPPPKRPPPVKPRVVPRLLHGVACPRACVVCKPALDRALAWLVRRQRPDGRFTKPRGERVLRKDGKELVRSIDEIDVALTAFAGFALHASGKHDARAQKAAAYLVRCTRPDGIVATTRGNDPVHLAYANFQTPLAALFLAEAPDDAGRRALQRIADYLQRVQDKTEGAWGYGPGFNEHPRAARRGWRLLATTQVCLAALRRLNEIGIAVDAEVIARAERYLLSCRGKDGAFVYKAAHRYQNGVPGTTASVLAAIDGDDAAWARYRRHFTELDAFGRHRHWFLFWTALAMYRRGAAFPFERALRDRVLHDQKANGCWEDPDEGGSVLATAVCATVLQLRTGRVKLAAVRPVARGEPVKRARYIKPPLPASRVKVFRHEDHYRYDLIVSFETDPGPTGRARFAAGLRGANRIVYDVTDGQFVMNRVEIVVDKSKWKTADIRITKEFYNAENNPHPYAHGVTRLGRRTRVGAGPDRPGKRIGIWILFPPKGIRWDHPRAALVIAHELGHYLFGAKDEYGKGAGVRCDCLMGLRGQTELCRGSGHTDDRQPDDCWTLAKRLYPKLTVPETTDPGPWAAPEPLITGLG